MERCRIWDEFRDKVKLIVVWMRREREKEKDDIVDKEFGDNLREGKYPERSWITAVGGVNGEKVVKCRKDPRNKKYGERWFKHGHRI